MSTQFWKRGLVIVAALALLAALVIALPFGASYPVEAAPMAAPTPLSVVYSPGTSTLQTIWSSEVITADGCSSLFEIRDVELIDLHWIVDVGDVNTTTLTLRFTNENSVTNLVTGAAVASSIAADQTNLQQFGLYGRYFCLYADVSNTNPITITALGKSK
jgi:hypothetical protein